MSITKIATVTILLATAALAMPAVATQENETSAAKANQLTDATSSETGSGMAPGAPLDAAPEAAEDLESKWARGFKEGRFSWSVMLLVVFIGGLATNLTPCVYPMIPITLRLLSRQGISPIASGSAYGAGILATYTALGVSAALSGGLFGSIMASSSFNVVFAALMALLGLSMLGLGNFTALQSLGSRLGAGKPSLRNTFLMGAGAGLVASPCTGPILAALLAYTAGSQDPKQGAFLLFLYSLGFALPYVFLGGAATRLSTVKVSPKVQIGVKLGFASVMFALAFFYLRIPAYSLFTRLSNVWTEVALSAFGLGALVTAVWVVSAKLQAAKLWSALPAVLLGLGIFSLSQTLPSFSGGAAAKAAPIHWIKSEEEAFREAKRLSRPILVDAWAEWCAACKKMDETTFVDPELTKLLSERWVLLKLDLTESNEQNDQLQQKYGLQSLPALVMLPPEGELAKKQMIGGYVEASTLLESVRKFEAALR